VYNVKNIFPIFTMIDDAIEEIGVGCHIEVVKKLIISICWKIFFFIL